MKHAKKTLGAIACAIMIIMPSSAVAQELIEMRPYYEVPMPCAKYVDEIERYSDWNTVTIIKIMHMESRCRSDAIGDGHLRFGNGIYGMSCGLLQIRILPKRNVTCKQMKDPKMNIEKAHEIYLSQGYEAWSVFKRL